MQRDFLLQFSIDIYFFSLSLTRCSLCMLKKMLEEGKDFFFWFCGQCKNDGICGYILAFLEFLNTLTLTYHT